MEWEIFNALIKAAIVTQFVFCSGTEGYKVKVCSGETFNAMSCQSGSTIDIKSAVGGFGSSGTPCYTTAVCITRYLQRDLSEVHGNLEAFAINTCKNKQTCSFSVDRNWKSASSYCNGHGYDIIYLDVEYICSPLAVSSSPKSVSSSPTESSLSTSTEGNSSGKTLTSNMTSTITTTTTPTTAVTDISNSKSTSKDDEVTKGTDIMKQTTPPKWIWFAVGGVIGFIVIAIIIIVVVFIPRKRQSKEVCRTEQHQAVAPNVQSMRQSTVSSDEISDITAYHTTVNMTRNKPDILYDTTDTTNEERISDSNEALQAYCYSTTGDVKAMLEQSTTNEVNNTVNVEGTCTSTTLPVTDNVYAVVRNDQRKQTVPSEDNNDSAVIENVAYERS